MELISNHQQGEFRKGQKVTPRVQPPPRILLTAIHLGKDSESEWLAKDNLETNPITRKPQTASHVAEKFSWVPLPYCSPPGHTFSIKSLALSAFVSPWTIQFQVLDKSPLLGPGRGSPSCNKMTSCHNLLFLLSVSVSVLLFLSLSPRTYTHICTYVCMSMPVWCVYMGVLFQFFWFHCFVHMQSLTMFSCYLCFKDI